jgi:hypothetical protein
MIICAFRPSARSAHCAKLWFLHGLHILCSLLPTYQSSVHVRLSFLYKISIEHPRRRIDNHPTNLGGQPTLIIYFMLASTNIRLCTMLAPHSFQRHKHAHIPIHIRTEPTCDFNTTRMRLPLRNLIYGQAFLHHQYSQVRLFPPNSSTEISSHPWHLLAKQIPAFPRVYELADAVDR